MSCGATGGPSTKAVAVAVVALTKCLLSRDPAFAQSLEAVLQSAENAGITPADLNFLKMLVEIGR